MNPLFYPDKNKQHKNTLVAKKKLVQNSRGTDTVSNGIPDNWYYNENQAEDIWKSFEQVESQAIPKQDNVSPFVKIDESAQKIKSLIDNYEMTDHDLLFGLLDILGDTDEMMDLDRQTIFMEARYSLQKLIDNHEGNSEAQQQMMDSLRGWFQNVQNYSKEDMANLPKLTDVNFDTQELAQLINSCAHNSETTVEAATTLHQSIIETLKKQIDIYKQQIQDKDQEIQRLRASMELVSRGRRRAKTIAVKSHEEQQAIIQKATKKIVVQDMKINELKSTITQMKDEQDAQINLPEEEPPGYDGIDPAILAERELEFDTKQRLLNETIQQLREENADLSTKTKQDKIAITNMENKISNQEAQIKTLTGQLQSEHKNHVQQIDVYKKKTEDLLLKLSQTSQSKDTENAMKLELQRQLQKQAEQLKNQFNIQMDQNEKKQRAAMQDLLNHMKSDNSQGVVNTLIKQQEETVDRLKTQYEQRIFELKESNTQRLQINKTSYEQKIKALQKEFEQYKANQDEYMKTQIDNAKVEMDKEKRKEIYDAQVENNKQLTEVRQKLMLRIDTLKAKTRKLQNERDSLRSLVAMSDQNGKMPDIISNEDEEETVNEELSELDPEFVKIQIEQALLKQQEEHEREMYQMKKALDQSKDLEIKKIKESLQNAFELKLQEQKDDFVEKLTNIIENSQEKPPIELKNFIMQISDKPIEDEKTKEITEATQAMIAFDEYKSLYEKNSKLQDENEFLKTTLEKMNKNGQQFNGDVISAMRKTVADEAQQITRVFEENKILKIKLAEKEGKTTTELTIQLRKLRETKAPLCTQFLQYLNPHPAEPIFLNLKLSDVIGEDVFHDEEKAELSIDDSQIIHEFACNETRLDLKDFTNSEVNFEKSVESKIQLEFSSSSLFDIEQPPNEIKEEKTTEKPHIHLTRSSDQIQFQKSPIKTETRILKLDETHVRSFESLPVINEHKTDSSRVSTPDSTRRKVSFTFDTNSGIPEGVSSLQSPLIAKEKVTNNQPIKQVEVRKVSLKLFKTETTQIFHFESKPKQHIDSSVQVAKIESPQKTHVYSGNRDSSQNISTNENEGEKSLISLAQTKMRPMLIQPIAKEMRLLSQRTEVEDDNEQIPLKPLHQKASKSTENFNFNDQKASKSTENFNINDQKASKSTENFNINQLKEKQNVSSCEIFSINPNNRNISKTFKVHTNNSIDVLPKEKIEDISQIKFISNEPTKPVLSICYFNENTISKPSAKIMLSTAKSAVLNNPAHEDPILKRFVFTIFNIKPAEKITANQQKERKEQLPLKQTQSAEVFVNVSENEENQSPQKVDIPPVTSHSMESFIVPTLTQSLSQEFEVEKRKTVDLNAIKDKALFETKVNALKERQNALYDLFIDIEGNYKDLVKKHTEVVNALKQANEMAFSAIKTVGTTHPETLIEQLQSQAAYLTNVIMERDSLSSSFNEQQILADKQNIEAVNAKEELAVVQNEKEDLKDQVSNLMNLLAVQKISRPVSPEKSNQKENIDSKENESINEDLILLKKQIQNLTKRAEEAETMNRKLTEKNEINEQELRRKETQEILKTVEKHVFDGIKVGPFVIFDTVLQKELPKKGFSLTPVINEFEELPIRQSVSIELSQVSTSPIKGVTPLNSGRSTSTPILQNHTKPPPLPAGTLTIKKPILPITGSKGFHNSLKSSLPDLKQQQGTPLKEAGRSHSFDTFAPIKKEDKTVVYVTRYVTREKHSDSSQKNSSRNSAFDSSVATGRLDSQRPPSNQSINRGMIKTTTSPLTVLKNRIEALEAILQNKSHQVLNGKDKEHALNQALFRLTSDYGKMEREFTKMNVINNQYKEKISDSLALIQRLTAENDELRQLLKEARKTSIANEMFSKRSADQEFAQVEELKRRKIIHSAYQTGSLANDDFLSRQEAAAIRWQRKREIIQERERNRMYNVLKAMHLTENKNNTQNNGMIQLISTKEKEKEKEKMVQEKKEIHNSARGEIVDPMPTTPQSAKISYEDATKNAAKGKVPKKLKMGLIAEPYKIYK